MNDSTKRKLTPEVAAGYYQNTVQTESSSGCFPILLFFICPPLGLVLLLMSASQKPAASDSVTGDRIVIYEDMLVKKSISDNCGDGEDDYILHFSKSGLVYTDRHGEASGTSRPGYEQVREGEKFYVAAVPGEKVPRIYFSQREWVRQMSSAKETQAAGQANDPHQALIDRIIADGKSRFPEESSKFLKEEVQSRLNDPRALKVQAGKPREEMNLAEKLAVDYFAGYVAPGLEYICRFCRVSVEREAKIHFTQAQMALFETLQEKIYS